MNLSSELWGQPSVTFFFLRKQSAHSSNTSLNGLKSVLLLQKKASLPTSSSRRLETAQHKALHPTVILCSPWSAPTSGMLLHTTAIRCFSTDLPRISQKQNSVKPWILTFHLFTFHGLLHFLTGSFKSSHTLRLYCLTIQVF